MNLNRVLMRLTYFKVSFMLLKMPLISRSQGKILVIRNS